MEFTRRHSFNGRGFDYKRVLDPMERISEILFDLIMALTFTCTPDGATADSVKVQTVLIGASPMEMLKGKPKL